MKVAKKATKWIATNQGEVAKFFNVSISAVQLWVKSGMPGKPGRYPLDKIAQWRDTRKSPTGGASRLSDIRASLSELDLEERRGRLCDMRLLQEAMERWSGLLHDLNDQLTKRFGAEVAASFDETLNECERVIDELSHGSTTG